MPDARAPQDSFGGDSLENYRDRFLTPKRPDGRDCIYLCGHSLGLQPVSARGYVTEELDSWAMLGVEGHFREPHPWLNYHSLLSAQMAKLVGGHIGEVVVMNGLTVNLHLMLTSFYRPTPNRFRVLIEGNAFSSDRYAVQSQIALHGFDPSEALLELKPRPSEATYRTDDVLSVIEREGHSIALVLLGGLNYYTGQFFEIERITRAAHAQGCLVGFDFAHAVGNVVLELHDWGVDFAVWCTYKYLNAGPGGVGGCFVHDKHSFEPHVPRLTGWWGHDPDTRFEMPHDFSLIPGAAGWQLSNPPILQLAALRASLDIFGEVGMLAIREKSELLTTHLESRLAGIPEHKMSILTPQDKNQRGAQVSLDFKEYGRKLFHLLRTEGVVCDWREPNAVRISLVPLYNTLGDVDRFAEIVINALTKSI